jgi:hypothetical protein
LSAFAHAEIVISEFAFAYQPDVIVRKGPRRKLAAQTESVGFVRRFSRV